MSIAEMKSSVNTYSLRIRFEERRRIEANDSIYVEMRYTIFPNLKMETESVGKQIKNKTHRLNT